MRNPYYLVWSNAILNFWKHNPKNSDWKFITFTFITWMQALNLWTIIIWLKYFDIIVITTPQINLFPGDMIDGFLSFAIIFAVPFIPINYFLIFARNRYKTIVKKYNQTSPNHAFRYIIVSALTALFTAFFYGYLTN